MSIRNRGPFSKARIFRLKRTTIFSLIVDPTCVCLSLLNWPRHLLWGESCTILAANQFSSDSQPCGVTNKIVLDSRCATYYFGPYLRAKRLTYGCFLHVSQSWGRSIYFAGVMRDEHLKTDCSVSLRF